MCVCVSVGGLAAVIYTDALQTLIMVGGAFALMFIGKVYTLSHTHMVNKGSNVFETVFVKILVA